jgi:hemin uptake protein HemP
MAQHEKTDDKTDGKTGAGDAHAMPAQSALRRITTKDLFGADREIILDHEGAAYHLRVTSNGRLILTK